MFSHGFSNCRSYANYCNETTPNISRWKQASVHNFFYRITQNSVKICDRFEGKHGYGSHYFCFRNVSACGSDQFCLIWHLSQSLILKGTCLVLPSPCSQIEIVLNAWWFKPGFCQIVLCITAVELNFSFHQTSGSFFLTPQSNPCPFKHLHSLYRENNPQM